MEKKQADVQKAASLGLQSAEAIAKAVEATRRRLAPDFKRLQEQAAADKKKREDEAEQAALLKKARARQEENRRVGLRWAFVWFP